MLLTRYYCLRTKDRFFMADSRRGRYSFVLTSAFLVSLGAAIGYICTKFNHLNTFNFDNESFTHFNVVER